MFMDNRDQFLEMLSKAEKDEIDVVVVMRLDRFSRDATDAILTNKLLNSYGCTLIAGDVSTIITCATDELTLGVSALIGQYFARITANRVMHSEIHNAEKGDSAGGQPPYGLQLVNKQYELNPDEAPAVKQMFSMISKRKELSAGY
jgi:site-specific DNA recombinase